VNTTDKLLAAAAQALSQEGVASLSARSIAARAQVNQALIFYHFGSLGGLLDAAVRRSVDEAVADYRGRLGEVATLSGLLELGNTLHSVEK